MISFETFKKKVVVVYYKHQMNGCYFSVNSPKTEAANSEKNN